MRHAALDDIPALVAMGRKFHESASPPWPFSPGGFAKTLNELIACQYVAISEGGFIAGVMTENPLSSEWLVAREFLWWATDGSGAQLRAGFRGWAKEQGAREIIWSCPPDNKRVVRFFKKTAAATEVLYSEYVKCA